MNPRKAVLSSAPAKKGRVYAVDQYALWKDSRFYKRVGWSYWSHLSCTHFHEKIWPSPFTSDISIWCDAGAASSNATMENQKLQARVFFPSELWHGTSSSTLREMWGLLHSLESFLDIIRHKSVQIFTDNSNVVRVMGQGSTDLRLNNIVL